MKKTAPDGDLVSAVAVRPPPQSSEVRPRIELGYPVLQTVAFTVRANAPSAYSEGIEPSTRGLTARCSTGLSYEYMNLDPLGLEPRLIRL